MPRDTLWKAVFAVPLAMAEEADGVPILKRLLGLTRVTIAHPVLQREGGASQAEQRGQSKDRRTSRRAHLRLRQ